MININKNLARIRCNRYQYLIKKGSMSNYSFDILDEDKSGILELLFEKIIYPIEEENLKEQVKSICKNITNEKICEFIKNLKDIEVFEDIKENKNTYITLIIDEESKENLVNKLNTFNYNVKTILLDNTNEKIFSNDEEFNSLEYNEIIDTIKESEYIVFISKTFQPNLLYKINSLSIEFDKKMILAYLDGDEGLIIPIINPSKSGCYNDFEMLREASFHNLLDYQIMKEDKIKNNKNCENYNPIYWEILLDYTILLLNNYKKYSYINNYAYSLDFERMVTSKIRLLKFPKCPSCQGDSNLTHPFI